MTGSACKGLLGSNLWIVFPHSSASKPTSCSHHAPHRGAHLSARKPDGAPRTREGNPCPDFRVFLLTRRNIQWPCHLHVRLSVYPMMAPVQSLRKVSIGLPPLVLRKCTHREMHPGEKSRWKSATLSWNLQVGLLCTSACIAELGFQLRSLEQPMGR